jgi:hypothetical protein
MSVICEDGIGRESSAARWLAGIATKLVVVVCAFAAAAFLWSFALPLIGLAVFVARFFAG